MQEATDLADLFACLAHAVVSSLKADACLVSIHDREREVVRDVAASVVPPARLHAVAEEYPLVDFPATRAVIETGESIEVSASDASADAAERAFLKDVGFGRVLITRLALGTDTVGTIETYRLVDHPFPEDGVGRIELLTTFARNAHARIVLAAKLDEHYTKTIEALVSALEARDPYTQAHAGRIRDTSMALAVALRLPRDERRAVKLGSILHDVGKIGISDSILLKPGALTDGEWDVMRSHPEIGERMLQGIDFLSSALPIVRHHHERWDGGGYPDGVRGPDIPVGARIVAVCDAFDAMTSTRPYRPAMPLGAACEELMRGAGRQFDPDCAGLLVDVVSHLPADLNEERLQERFVHYANG
ncbi:MAG TPA: HD-GYP domain-containing protein [Actinomycetota bacterium]|nr:HD-GYP domain-containing protein [Actinomycetota bacterium]